MHPTTILIALGSLALAAALPQIDPNDDVRKRLLVTFWENGCHDAAGQRTSQFDINTSSKYFHSGDCVQGSFGFESKQSTNNLVRDQAD